MNTCVSPRMPSDLRGALQTLQEDPGMFDRLESAKTGERDGRFSVKDVRTLQDSPDMKAYTDLKVGLEKVKSQKVDCAIGVAVLVTAISKLKKEIPKLETLVEQAKQQRAKYTKVVSLKQ